MNPSSTNSNNIKTYIRLRPISAEKLELPFDYELNENEISLRKINQQARSYCFDGIFSDQAKQEELSETIIDPLIQQVKEGFNCTVLAYGQTGTGKTFTIEGDYLQNISKSPLTELNINFNQQQLPNKAGLVPRAFFKLFNLLTDEDQFKVSAIEIYNEDVFDLLADHSDSLRIYESQKGVTLSNLREYSIKDANDLNIILQKSNSKRQFASTLMNKRSSRSHVIFQFVLHTKETTKNNHVIERIGKLNLVDLAGSECAKRTGCQDLRALEAGNINRSLLTLTRVIDALVKNQKYIPFRSSNLTRIIQDTLGGNSKTVLIATLSPALIDFEDTLNTLSFAATVKQVKNNASANVKVIQNHYYEEKLKELEENLLLEQSKQEELKQNYELELRSKEENLEEMENELESKDEEIKRLKRDLSKLNDELKSTKNLKENDLLNQPALKKQRTTSSKPLSNTVNNAKQRKSARLSNDEQKLNEISDEFLKLIKKDVNGLFKDNNLLSKRINKMKTLNTSQENLIKEIFDKTKSKDKLVCDPHLEEDLSSFISQMFNYTIQDEFDLFFEHLTEIESKLSDDALSKELQEKFNETVQCVQEKLELVKETIDNKLASNDEQLKKYDTVINGIYKIASDLKKEITESVKVSKKCKDKVKDMKNVMPI